MKEGEMPCSESAMPHINPLPYIHDTPGSPTPTGSEFKNQDAKVQKIFFLFLFSTLVLLVVFRFLIICCWCVVLNSDWMG